MKVIKGILALLPLVITAAVLPIMPEQVPMHYNIEGAVDRMGSRYELLLLPVLVLLVVAVSELAAGHYARRAEGPEDDKDVKAARINAKTMHIISYALPVFFGVMQVCVLYMTYRNSMADNKEVNSEMIVRVTHICLGIMFAVFGYYMPKTERNNMFGFRTKWSMYNDNTWHRCNKLGGIIFIIVGLLLIITAAVLPANAITFTMLGYLLIATVILIVYSRKVYKEEIR